MVSPPESSRLWLGLFIISQGSVFQVSVLVTYRGRWGWGWGGEWEGSGETTFPHLKFCWLEKSKMNPSLSVRDQQNQLLGIMHLPRELAGS